MTTASLECGGSTPLSSLLRTRRALRHFAKPGGSDRMPTPAPFRATLALLLALLCPAATGAPPAHAAPAPSPQPATKRLIIIAPDRFHPALAEFARFKRHQLPTELCSLETILRDTPGAD